MTLEELDQALNYPTLTVAQAAMGDESFNRIRSFEINGQYFSVVWWTNRSYLHAGALTIPFETVKQSNTWPHASKMNLQFYDDNNLCAILKLE